MVAPMAREMQGLTELDIGKVTHDSDQVSGPGSFESGNRIAGITGMIGQAFNHTL